MADDEQPDEEASDDPADGDAVDDDAVAAEWAAAEGGGDDDALAAEWGAAAEGGEGAASGHGEEAVYEVPVEISAVLGIAEIPVSQLLKMGRGAVLELDRVVGDPVDIYVDKQLVGRGDVVVVDEKLGVTLHDTIRKS